MDPNTPEVFSIQMPTTQETQKKTGLAKLKQVSTSKSVKK